MNTTTRLDNHSRRGNRPKKVTLTISINPEMIDDLYELMEKQGYESMSMFARHIFGNYIAAASEETS